jgi:hypothetical protein
MPEQTHEILRVEIEGEWTAEEFAKSFRSFDELYSLRALIQVEHESLDELEMYAHDFPPFMRRFPRRLRALYLARGVPFLGVVPPLIDLRAPEAAFGLLEPQERLRVTRVQFSSPGFKDLAGLGEVVGHVKDFVLRLIDLYVGRDQRRIENEIREADLSSKRLDNARKFVELARDCGYTKTDMRKLVQRTDSRQGDLISLITTGKIRDAKLIDEQTSRKG